MIVINDEKLYDPVVFRDESKKYRLVNMQTLLIAQAEQFSNSYNDVQQLYEETVRGLARALELRDKEAIGHAERVTFLTEKFARKLGFAEKELVDIRRGALLHDIGKIGIPDSILFKPDQLTAQEWEIMKKHPLYAYELLSPISYLQTALDIPYCHHEHWDGYGYPRGLSGEEIPCSARLFTIIDVWDALSSDRCYRPAWRRNDIVDYLHSQSGKIFDPYILPKFVELIDEPQIKYIDQAASYQTSPLIRSFISEPLAVISSR
jgi:putative nucleotidyltransferase with HDIG domain